MSEPDLPADPRAEGAPLSLEILAARIDSLLDDVDEVARAVSGLQLPAALPLPPWNWALLAPAMRDQAWRDLTGWVEWWVGEYALESDVPTCWIRHRDLVELLLGLRSWHREVWSPPAGRNDEGRPVAPTVSARAYVDWQIVGMPAVLARVRDATRSCSGGRAHSDAVPPERQAERRMDLRQDAELYMANLGEGGRGTGPGDAAGIAPTSS